MEIMKITKAEVGDTVFLSCGKKLKKSCEMAIKYVNHAIGTGPKYGRGHGPINHLNAISIKKKFR